MKNSWGKRSHPWRDQVVIATKFGFKFEGDNRAAQTAGRAHQGGGEASLKRLQTDHIDLFYQHRVDPAVAIEQVAAPLKDLISGR